MVPSVHHPSLHRSAVGGGGEPTSTEELQTDTSAHTYGTHDEMTISPTPIKSIEQFEDIASINGPKPVLVDFYASWCNPCTLMRPLYTKLSSSPVLSQQMGFYTVNVDEQSDIAAEVGVRAMPSFVVFVRGKSVGEVRGADPKGLLALIQRFVSS